MEKNKKLLKTSLILIAITLVISMGTSFYLKLDKPVFLLKYMDRDLPIYDTGYYGDVEFHLRYITNANDTKMVNHIEFPEAPNLMGYSTETGGAFLSFFPGPNQIPGQRVGTYSVRTIYVKIDAHNIPVSEDEIHLSKARVHFTNEEIIDVELGEIVLYGYRRSDEYLNHYSGRSSSDGTSSTLMKAIGDITVHRVESPFLSKFKHLIELKINDTDYDNISKMVFKSGDELKVFSKFHEPTDIIEKLSEFNIHPKIYFEDNEGNTHAHRIYDINYRQHSFEFMDIIKYLRARGEL